MSVEKFRLSLLLFELLLLFEFQALPILFASCDSPFLLLIVIRCIRCLQAELDAQRTKTEKARKLLQAAKERELRSETRTKQLEIELSASHPHRKASTKMQNQEQLRRELDQYKAQLAKSEHEVQELRRQVQSSSRFMADDSSDFDLD